MLPAPRSTRPARRTARAAVLALGAAAVAGSVLLAAPAIAVVHADDWEDPVEGTVLDDRTAVREAATAYWTGDWGQLVLDIRDDGLVLGSYSFDQGEIIGWLADDVIDAWWCEQPDRLPPGNAGRVQFRVVTADDGTPTLDGRWIYGETAAAWSENWDLADRAAPGTAPEELRGRLAVVEAECASPILAASRADRDFDAGEPSTLSALQRVQDLTPAAAATGAVVAVVLVAIAAYPSVLLDATLTANADRLTGWTAPVRRRVGPVVGRLTARLPWWVGVAGGLLLVLLISGFVDPRFGPNAGSLRLAASLAIALLLERLAVLLVIRRLSGGSGAPPRVRFAIESLVVVAVAVLLTRVTGFEPGIVFGLVLALSFARELSRVEEARVALVTAGWAFGLGILGWLLYSLLGAVLGPDPGPIGVFATETAAALTVSGLAALPIALLPLGVLDGAAIWAWRRVVWAAAYVLSLAAFLIVVLPLPTSWAEVPSVGAWIALYVGYCLLAVGVWAAFRWARPRGRPAPAPTTSAPGAVPD